MELKTLSCLPVWTQVYRLHSPVKSFLKTKHPSGKLARWGEVVSEFDLEVKYRPGCKNANADALS